MIYLDNAATTKASDRVAALCQRMLTEDYGNPSSLHTMGQSAEGAVKNARKLVSRLFDGVPERIVFTSGGSEAINLALMSAFKNPARISGKKLIISSVEHPAVYECAKRIAEMGASLVILPTDRDGVVDIKALEAELDKDTLIVSVMRVSNETGLIQPVAEIARIIKRYNDENKARILFHADSVQAFGKLPPPGFFPGGSSAYAGPDLISVSAHKLHGPKGVGALYARWPERLSPLIYGGGQERGIRSGTENVPAIAGFGEAVSELLEADSIMESYRNAMVMRDIIIKFLRDKIPGFRLLSPEISTEDCAPGTASPYILSLSFPGLRGEVLLHELESRGVFVSTGSACSSLGAAGSVVKKKGRVLSALGFSDEETTGAIRLSTGRFNTPEEVLFAAREITDSVKKLGKMRSGNR